MVTRNVQIDEEAFSFLFINFWFAGLKVAVSWDFEVPYDHEVVVWFVVVLFSVEFQIDTFFIDTNTKGRLLYYGSACIPQPLMMDMGDICHLHVTQPAPVRNHLLINFLPDIINIQGVVLSGDE